MVRGTRFIAESVLLALIGCLFAAVLLRNSPGYGVDVREADSTLSEQTVQQLRAEREADAGLATFAARYLRGLVRGDLGYSQSANRPVADLLLERLPSTAALVVQASLLAFGLACATAAAVALARRSWPAGLAAAANTMLLTLPAGVIALLAVFTRTGAVTALAVLVASRIYLYCDRLVSDRLGTNYAVSAEALGLSRARILYAHVLPSAGGELTGVAGLAVVTALNASIPIEVLCGRAGLGQLAWSGAMERDLPVIVAVTLVMVLLTRLGTAISRLLLPAAGAGPS